jgi:hypothetical protein
MTIDGSADCHHSLRRLGSGSINSAAMGAKRWAETLAHSKKTGVSINETGASGSTDNAGQNNASTACCPAKFNSKEERGSSRRARLRVRRRMPPVAVIPTVTKLAVAEKHMGTPGTAQPHYRPKA